MSERESSTRRKWREIIRRQRASNLPISTFCGESGIAVSTFFFWKRRLCNAAGPKSDVAPAFVEARVIDAHPSAGRIEIRLRGRRRLIVCSGFDRNLLAEVVAVIEGLPVAPAGLPGMPEGVA